MAADEERAALLAAIADAPGSDAPLLVYADWLVGRGDPLGELIHAQLALAAERPGTAAHARLRAWELRILRAHEARLAGPLHHEHLRWRYARGAPVAFGHAGHFRAPPPSREDGDNAIWLRFSPDGEAAVVWAPEDAPSGGLDWDRDRAGWGRYTLAIRGGAAAIAFSAVFAEGAVDYAATLEGGELTASIHSRINGWRHETRFSLVHASAPGPDTRDALTEPASRSGT